MPTTPSLDYGDLSHVRTNRDRSGMGETKQVFVGNVLVWVHSHAMDGPLDEEAKTLFEALETWLKPGKQVYRTVYRGQRDLDRHPDINPVRLPVTVYSSSDNLDFQREDLTYLRSNEHDAAEAWIETRTQSPWRRTDD